MLKGKRLLFLVLAIAATSAVVYAAYTVWSGPVYVHLGYAVDITNTSYSGSTISLTARVTDNGAGVSGVNVDFYYSTDGTNFYYFGTAGPTDGGGYVIGTFNAGDNGDYWFKAAYSVP